MGLPAIKYFIFQTTIVSFLILGSFFSCLSQTSHFIDSIIPQTFIIIDSIKITGNKTTKEHIILRELVLKKNDTIITNDFEKKIERSISNLNNTSLFNLVAIDTISTTRGHVLLINVIERWYFWPFPYFELIERNFNTWWETKDLNKINYGLYFVKENFRGRREDIRFTFKRGFEEDYSISYNIPYINKKQTLGMGFMVGLRRNKEVAYNVLYNKLAYFRVNDFYIRENFQSTLQFSYRENFHQTHQLWLSFNKLSFADTLIKQNDFFSKNGINTNTFFSINYFFKNDHRDIKAYPLKGYYFDFDINKHGLGLLANENTNIFYIRSTYRRYYQLKERLFYALGNKIKYSNYDFQPFFLKKGLGFGNDYIRGYEYYVVDGISYWVFKNNIKYCLIKPTFKRIKFIKSEKFNAIHYAAYINLFFDTGYALDFAQAAHPSNNLSNSLLFGYGAGLDVVTYYDKVLRIEYSFNKMLEKGIFFNFVAPI